MNSPRVAGANPRNKRCQQLNLMLTRYNAACAEGAFSAQLTFDSNLTAHSRVMARRLPDVLPNRLLNSRTECSVTLPLTAEALGRENRS